MDSSNQELFPMGLKCIVCLRNLEPCFPHSNDMWQQPYEGTFFTTGGHYGSTVFDPMNSEYLNITVCDKCMVERARLGVITHFNGEKPQRWDVHEEELRYGK